MRTTLSLFTVALCLVMQLRPELLAATPDQAYHRTPVCVDGNCVPNRATNGYHATRWRPWPGGEPSQNKPVPPVGIELNKIEEPVRDRELEMPVRPTAPGDATTTEPSPNDRPSGGIVLPPELRDMTPKRPVEETRPGNSSFPRGPLHPGMQPGPNFQPILLSKKPEQLRPLSPVPPPHEMPAVEPPLLKIRPAGNSQSGLMPEMVPWNDEEKNPIVRQAARITGNQVQHTLSLDEAALPDANEDQARTIRVQHESSPAPSFQASAIGMLPVDSKSGVQPLKEPAAKEIEWRSPTANAPAILPNIEAQPLSLSKAEPNSGNTTTVSPLRGLSQGNPLRP
jgi:hypothetical protein